MLDKYISQKYLFYTFYASSIIGFIGLWFSPFLVSLATGIIALCSLPFLAEIWKEYRALVMLFLGLILLTTFDFLRTSNTSTVSAKLMLVVGFIFLQLGSLKFLQKRENEAIWLVLLFGVIVLIVNSLAVGNYLMHKEYYDKMLLQSKAIPVLRMHHIHFGIVNGLMLLLLVGLYVKSMLNGIQTKLVIVLFIGIFICFHMLGSRTGLLSFYVASLVGLIGYAISTKKYKTLILGVILIGIALSSAYILSTSFKNKISNSVEDYQSWSHGEDINYKSMAMRLEAYKACIGILKVHPVLGVGAGNQEMELQAMYEQQNSVLVEENRVGPHNQLLEFGIKYGILGIVLVLGYFFYFLKGVRPDSYLFIAILVMLFASMQLESLWERQGSIFFSTILLSLSYHLFNQQKNIIQE